METLVIPFEGKHLHGYFVRSPVAPAKTPVLIGFGGLDSFKEELYFMLVRGALSRGISCLLMDGPGQGAALRREGLITRFDYEVPVGRCVDYLETRADVDLSRIAVSGTSLGGYYAARAACFEHRLAAVISHGAIWDLHELMADRDDSYGLAGHFKWVFGLPSMAEVKEKSRQFTLNGVLRHMRCPYLIVHGGHDVLGVQGAGKVYDHARESGVDVTLKVLNAEETGAEHCQHDNPTIAQEYMFDWLADRFRIDQRAHHS
jgi:dienelactone hydrolase